MSDLVRSWEAEHPQRTVIFQDSALRLSDGSLLALFDGKHCTFRALPDASTGVDTALLTALLEQVGSSDPREVAVLVEARLAALRGAG